MILSPKYQQSTSIMKYKLCVFQGPHEIEWPISDHNVCYYSAMYSALYIVTVLQAYK